MEELVPKYNVNRHLKFSSDFGRDGNLTTIFTQSTPTPFLYPTNFKDSTTTTRWVQLFETTSY